VTEPRHIGMDTAEVIYREFSSRREGMIFAMEGGLWLHRHIWRGTPMAHLVSTDRALLLEYGRRVVLPAERLQFKALKDPRTGIRRDAWHWDLIGRFLPRPTLGDSRIVLVDASCIDRRR
jgi:hypothetical protein